MDLSLEIARRCVARYRGPDDELMARVLEAEEHHDHEERLARGLDAYWAMCRAETVVRQAAVEGIAVEKDIPETLRFFYEQWLEMEPGVLAMIDAQKQRGFTVEREVEFRAACDDIRSRLAVVQAHDVLDNVAEGRVFGFHDLPPTMH